MDAKPDPDIPKWGLLSGNVDNDRGVVDEVCYVTEEGWGEGS